MPAWRHSAARVASVAAGGGGESNYLADIGNAEEVAFTTAGGLGEAEVGGPILNIIPRVGGNENSG